MKSVFFVRHAKSSWDDISLNDHDRPLNKRGKNDAQQIGEYLNKKKYKIDIIITSSAKRARLTATRINDIIVSENFIVEPKLYLASTRQLMEVVKNIHNEVDSAAIFAHNPGMTDLANLFTNESIYNVPTTGVFKVDFDVEDWSLADIANGKFVFFIYPKLLNNE